MLGLKLRSMATERKKYDKSFKTKAVELSFARNNVNEVAEELGIKAQQLSVWRKQYRENGDVAFPGNGNIKQSESEKAISALKRELREMTMERDILKKAISIFSSSDKKNTRS
jgi:transposase